MSSHLRPDNTSTTADTHPAVSADSDHDGLAAGGVRKGSVFNAQDPGDYEVAVIASRWDDLSIHERRDVAHAAAKDERSSWSPYLLNSSQVTLAHGTMSATWGQIQHDVRRMLAKGYPAIVSDGLGNLYPEPPPAGHMVVYSPGRPGNYRVAVLPSEWEGSHDLKVLYRRQWLSQIEMESMNVRARDVAGFAVPKPRTPLEMTGDLLRHHLLLKEIRESGLLTGPKGEALLKRIKHLFDEKSERES